VEDPQTDQLAAKEPELPAKAADRPRSERFSPPVPQSLSDTGLPNSIIEQLILKILYFKGDVMGSDLCRAIGLSFSLIEDMIDAFKFKQLIQVKSSRGYGPISALLSLTEQGRFVARDYLDNNQYVGPAPVSVSQYREAVLTQRMPAVWLTRERLANAYSHMVTTDGMLDQIGPAVTSGKSLLIYGQPGNGKTQVAEALSKIQSSYIYVPYALECQGNIIQLFDPMYHKPVVEAVEKTEGLDFEAQHDGRWALCRRPFIASGGELSLSMLDLSYNAVPRELTQDLLDQAFASCFLSTADLVDA
jgi:predicted ATPase with chaperone activity